MKTARSSAAGPADAAATPATPAPRPAAPRAGIRSLVGLAPLLAACLWGGMYVVSRASFATIPPITLGLLRVIIGGLTLWLALRLTTRARLPIAPSRRRLLVALASRRRLGVGPAASRQRTAPAQKPSSDQPRFLLLGATLAATIITQFWGTALASAHDGALLTTMTPVFVVPIAWVLLRERPGWRVLAGTGLALAGVIIVVAANAGSASSRSSLLGDALLLFSALCWALFTVLGAPVVRRRSALTASAYATLWSILLLLPFVPFELARHPIGPITPSLILAVLYLGWGATSLAWFLWYKGIEHLDAAVAAVFFFAQPLVGGLLSALFLRETLPPAFWLGGAVLAAGILLATLQKRSDAPGKTS